MLNHLDSHPEVYTQLEAIGQKLTTGIKNSLTKLGLNYTINQVGSMFTLFFTEHKVTNFETAKTSDLVLFGKYFQAMLKRGVYLAPSQYESLFLSTVLTDQHISQILEANEEALKEILS